MLKPSENTTKIKKNKKKKKEHTVNHTKRENQLKAYQEQKEKLQERDNYISFFDNYTDSEKIFSLIVKEVF